MASTEAGNRLRPLTSTPAEEQHPQAMVRRRYPFGCDHRGAVGRVANALDTFGHEDECVNDGLGGRVRHRSGT